MSTRADRPMAVLATTTSSPWLWVVVSGVVVAVGGGYLLGLGQVLPVAAAAAVLAATFFAYRWPVPVAIIVLLVSGGYSIFAMTPLWDIKATTLGGGVRLEDVFMIGMLAAGLVRASTRSGRRRLGKLLVPFLLLGAWLGLETLRNVAGFGLSAPGELRFFYLLLSVAFCLVASLDREARARTAIRAFVLVTVALPLVLLPLVLALNGWSFGPASRVFPSHVSLGLLLGLAVLWQGRDFVPWPRGALYLATFVGGLEILIDAHRSVWLAGLVMVAILLLLRQTFSAKIRWAFLGVFLAATVIVVTHGMGYDLVGVLADRGGAVLSQQDTAGIRLSLWRASLPLIVESPFVGRGLGMYWDLYLPDYGYTVHDFPHSLYVMVLVNLGGIGLLLCAWLWVRAWRICLAARRSLRSASEPGSPRFAYASVGLMSLGAIAAYGVAYGFELYSTTLAGVCLAGVMLSPPGRVSGETGDA